MTTANIATNVSELARLKTLHNGAKEQLTFSDAEFERRLSLALGAEPIRDWTYDGSLWRHLGFSTGDADPEQDTGP